MAHSQCLQRVLVAEKERNPSDASAHKQERRRPQQSMFAHDETVLAPRQKFTALDWASVGESHLKRA